MTVAKKIVRVTVGTLLPDTLGAQRHVIARWCYKPRSNLEGVTPSRTWCLSPVVCFVPWRAHPCFHTTHSSWIREWQIWWYEQHRCPWLPQAGTQTADDSESPSETDIAPPACGTNVPTRSCHDSEAYSHPSSGAQRGGDDQFRDNKACVV